MTLKPVGNKVLVKPSEPVAVSSGGILSPVAWQHPSGDGTVLAVGQGRTNRRGHLIPIGIKAGEKVTYRWLDGIEVDYNGQKCKILSEDQILGVMV